MALHKSVRASYHGCRLTLQAKAKKNRSGENFQVHTTDFLFAKTSVRFCLFLANDSNEHSQLNTIKCDYNGRLYIGHSVVRLYYLRVLSILISPMSVLFRQRVFHVLLLAKNS